MNDGYDILLLSGIGVVARDPLLEPDLSADKVIAASLQCLHRMPT